MSPVIRDLDQYGPSAPPREPPTRVAAEAYCRALAASHYENFTVVSYLFPHHLRQPLANIYAWCRWADDLADEVGDQAKAHALLDWWEQELDRLDAPDQRHPVLIALAPTVREYDLPRQLFRDLISAFRQDQSQTRYANQQELLDYCRRSANPVGRLVLHVGRSFGDQAAELSDSICTGLQLVNFWQDVARDAAKGRVYLPADSLARFGLSADQALAGEPRDRFRTILEEEVADAEQRLLAGNPLVSLVQNDLKLPIRVFLGGGLAIVAAIRRQGYDVWRQRPTVSAWTKFRLLAGAWWRGPTSDRP